MFSCLICYLNFLVTRHKHTPKASQEQHFYVKRFSWWEWKCFFLLFGHLRIPLNFFTLHFLSYNGVARQHGRHRQAKKELDRSGSVTSSRGSRRWATCERVSSLTVAFQPAHLLFSLTVFARPQPCRPRRPPACRRTTEASPPPGSTSSSTSSGRSSPPSRPGGRSRRCPLLVLLKMKTRKVSPEDQSSAELGHVYLVTTHFKHFKNYNTLHQDHFRSGRSVIQTQPPQRVIIILSSSKHINRKVFIRSFPGKLGRIWRRPMLGCRPFLVSRLGSNYLWQMLGFMFIIFLLGM